MAVSADLLVEVDRVSKSYGPVQALRDVSFGLRPGEVVGLVGDNGAGKSTLCRILSGADYPDSGTIRIRGTLVNLASPAVARKLGIETVYQDLALAPHLSIAGNIFLGREIRRDGILGKLGVLSESKMREEAETFLSSLRIQMGNLKSTVQYLSGGQRQAVAIARAAAWGSLMMILDEPTAALGVEESAKVLEITRSAADKGLAVVFVSHTLPYVMEATDRIVVLRHGALVADERTGDCTLSEVVGWITGAIGGNLDRRDSGRQVT